MKKKVKKIIPEAFIIDEVLKKEEEKKNTSDGLMAPSKPCEPLVNLPKKEEPSSVIIIDF